MPKPIKKRSLFIGRFCPFHKGHLSMMQKRIDEGKSLLILVRETFDDSLPAWIRKEMIEKSMSKLKIDAKVMIIDDIESVNYSRDVGYDIIYVDIDNKTSKISGTGIRLMIENGDNRWKDLVPNGADSVLENYLSGKGIIMWLFGLPSSGKTTIADAVSKELSNFGFQTKRLDGDVFRKTITWDLGFSKTDREKNLLHALKIADQHAKKGAIVISSFITPYEDIRKKLKKGLENVHLIFIKASVDVCKHRDSKGLYRKAMNNEIPNFTGISDPFEEPNDCNLIIDTEKHSVEENRDKIIDYIKTQLKL